MEDISSYTWLGWVEEKGESHGLARLWPGLEESITRPARALVRGLKGKTGGAKSALFNFQHFALIYSPLYFLSSITLKTDFQKVKATKRTLMFRFVTFVQLFVTHALVLFFLELVLIDHF